MQNININLVKEILVPDTGSLSQGDNNAMIVFSILGPIMLAVFLIILLTFFIQKKHYNYSANQKFNLHKISKTKILSIFGIVTLLAITIALNSQPNKQETASAATENALSISVEAFELDVAPTKEGAFAYASSIVKTSAPTDNGYTLSAYTHTPDLSLTGDTTKKISSITAANGTATALTANTWGIATTKPTDRNSAIWRGLPIAENNALILKKTNSTTTADDATEVFFGVNVNTDLTLGTYSGTVNYVVVANLPDCPAYSTCFNDNGADNPGTMAIRYHSSTDQELRLWAPNYKRAGYGFAGWNTEANGSGISYGPNATIPIEIGQYRNKGLNLYAMWVPSAGNLQNWTGCPALKKGEVTALTDIRDQQVYAVAKLADGKCWMIENLRLDNRNTSNSLDAQGYNPSFVGLADPEPVSSFSNAGIANTIYSTDGSTTVNITGIEPAFRIPRYNDANTNAPNIIMNNPENPVYAYGNYYTWTAAIADTSPYNDQSFNVDVTGTSICPASWHLPIGGIAGKQEENDFLALIIAASNLQPLFDTYSVPFYADGVGDTSGTTVSNILRDYPNNFTYNGSLENGDIKSRGSLGNYWSSTIHSAIKAFYLELDSNRVRPAFVGYDDGADKSAGRAIRCMISS